MKIIKSIGAIGAGFVVVIILSVVTDMIVEKLGIFPPTSHPEAYQSWMLVVALLYRTIFTIVGGYITARLSPSSAIKHAVILGILGMAVGTLGAVANWDKGNQWYPIALVIFAVPSTWFGGKLQAKMK